MVGGVIGRGAELARIATALAQLGDLTGSVSVVVVGEAGIGKSALLDAATGLARADGVTVLRGRVAPLGANLPFGSVAGALARHIDALDDDERRRLMTGLPALGTLVGGPAGAEPTAEGHDPDMTRLLLFQSVARFLGRAAATTPAVLIIDDLHWVDAATVELLAYLHVELASVPVGLVVALRPGEIDERPALRGLVRSLGGGRRATTVRLELLALDAARELAAQVGGPSMGVDALDDVVARAGGLPLAIEATARASVDGGPVAVPGYVVELFGDLIARLPDHHRAVLAALATAQTTTTATSVAAVTGVGEATMIDVLDDLERRWLVRRAEPAPGGTARYEGRHALIADGSLRRIGEGSRRALHAGWLSVLAQAGVPVERLALHAAAAGDAIDGRTAADVLHAAGRAALAGGAADAAARWLAAAVAALRRAQVVGAELAEDLADLATAWNLLGELTAARGALAEAADLLAGVDPARASALVSQAAVNDWLCGSRATLDQLGTRALRLAEASRSNAAIAHARCERHHMFARQDRVGEMVAEMTELQAVLDPHTTDGRLASFRASLVESYFTSNGVDRVFDDLPSDWAGASVALRRNTFGLALEAACLLGRWSRVDALLAEAGPHLLAGPVLPGWRSIIARVDRAWCRTEWDAVDEMLRDSALGVTARFAVIRDLLQARVLAQRGDRRAAADLVATADRHMANEPWLHPYRGVRAAVLIDALAPGEPPPRDVSEDDFTPGWHAMHEPAVRAAHGAWLVAGGRYADAGSVAASLRDLGGAGSRCSALAARLDGLVDRARGGNRARPLLLDAAGAFALLGHRFEAACAVVEACETARRPDDDRLLMPELELLERLGATPWSVRGRNLLGTARRWGPVELTPREQEVALLVAEGYANAQVAEALGVSIRTVTSHLDHAYTKLGIGSRAALATHVTRRQGAGAPT